MSPAPAGSRLPRLVVAAPASGQGKTTLATGLMAALHRDGTVVSGHKIGPDYIDPGFHAVATGRPGRNLDPHLVGTELIVPLLRHGAHGADLAIIEGVMGLFDGKVGTAGYASTAHVAALTESPVLLIVDASATSRTAAAVVHGLARFDDSVTVGGVVLNQVGSERHAGEVRRALESTGIPVLGALPRDRALAMPSRHLGLVPAAERTAAGAQLEQLADRVAQYVDLGAVRELAASAPGLSEAAWDPVEALAGEAVGRPGAGDLGHGVVAVAGGRAFTFRYPETEELLRAAGCEVRGFDPLLDEDLPAGTSGIYLGGGFPEVHAGELGRNTRMRARLREAVRDGVPTVAECAGLLYLCRSLDGVPMVGAIEAEGEMTDRLRLAYPTATAPGDSLLAARGSRVTGHEFHRTRVSPGHGDAGGAGAAWEVDGEPVGFATDRLHASYLHLHWAGYPHLAARFARTVRAEFRDISAEFRGIPRELGDISAELGVVPGESGDVRRARGAHAPATVQEPGPDEVRQGLAPTQSQYPRTRGEEPSTRGEQPPTRGEEPRTRGGSPLRHHGDVEARGMMDFAVNVYPADPPDWLGTALRGSLSEFGSYPDPGVAERELAAYHGREDGSVLATAGAAEAFGLLARFRAWSRPVVIHPQFTEPHAALLQAGHRVDEVRLSPRDGYRLDPGAIPAAADLVVIGNPTNPTGVLHPAEAILGLCRPGRLVAVDEAFIDTVPGETGSLAAQAGHGLVVIRSLTKQWAIPGVRAGYLLASRDLVAELREDQTPWSVGTTAIAAMRACATEQARHESHRRAVTLAGWRDHLQRGLNALGVDHLPSATSFVLARPGRGIHSALRERGIAVRRADTFPGLESDSIRIAVRPEPRTDRLLAALAEILPSSQRQQPEQHQETS